MPDIATREPVEFVAGETLIWERDYSADYPPSAGWTLKYEAVKTDKRLQFSAATSGTKYRVTLSAETTLAYSPFAGVYSWQSYVTKGTGAAEERHYLDTGTFTIKRAFSESASSTGYDDRTHVKKTLDAIEAVIEGRASIDQQSYTIMGRSLVRMKVDELLALRDKYRAFYKSEQSANALEAGLAGKNRILTRL